MNKDDFPPSTKAVLALKGAFMGMAEVIPGISGGTLALITGIYDQLVFTIKSCTDIIKRPAILMRPADLWLQINGSFLIPLLVGMFGGILVGLFGISYLLETYPEPLWAFFFGVTLASVVYLGKEEGSWSISHFGLFAVGALIAFAIVQLTPAQGSENLAIIFMAGAIAISALILPGISGSFMLLLMGLYGIVIPALKDVLSFDFSRLLLIVVFAAGCLTGLALFSRFLNYLLNSYRSHTMSLLIGFMAGSLYKLWPWRNPISVFDKESYTVQTITEQQYSLLDFTDLRILGEQNVLPDQYWGNAHSLLAVVTFFIGILSIYVFAKYHKSSRRNEG